MDKLKKKLKDLYPDDTFFFVEKLSGAFLGIDEPTRRAVYSITKAIEILMIDWNEDEATEWLFTNLVGAYVGQDIVVWVDDREFVKPDLTRTGIITILERYSIFLEKEGYLDTDWRAEPPYAIDEFLIKIKDDHVWTKL